MQIVSKEMSETSCEGECAEKVQESHSIVKCLSVQIWIFDF